MNRAFVIRPFDKKKDTAGKEIDFERIHLDLIAPALKATGLVGSTTVEIIESGNIRADMFSLIVEADLVICDVTVHNANVFYELGIRHSLRKKSTILIKGKPSSDQTPFDLLTDRYLPYDLDAPATSLAALVAMIKVTLRSERETDSPIFGLVPSLPEADPSKLQIIPVDFQEEVDRAQSAKSKGWLRLLAQDVRGLRFQQIGLQLIAKAQWELGDYESARESLELIRNTYRDQVEINLMLANIYERLFTIGNKADLLTLSEQAIDRVLVNKTLNAETKIEALTLKGRNQKTRWRSEFAGLSPVEKCREVAINSALRSSYEAYRAAFRQDLNHFYSGLAALQMATIFLDLTVVDNSSWKANFDDDEQAEGYRNNLQKDVEMLKWLVSGSIAAKLSTTPPSNTSRTWAEISQADLLFLTERSEQRVISRYKDIIPKDNVFAWDSAKRQLQLFAGLGVKADLANKVIQEVESQKKLAGQNPEEDLETGLPVQVVIFAGHRTDQPGREPKRFPIEQVSRAQELINETLSRVSDGFQVKGFSSAAPGADLLFQKACEALNIFSTVCLPMPRKVYAKLTFSDLMYSDWRSQFLDLVNDERRILELSDQEGLPRWLVETSADPWERGNRWVMEMAQAAGADKITLIALWDRKSEGDSPGGTAHMVQLANNAGNVYVELIDTKALIT